MFSQPLRNPSDTSIDGSGRGGAVYIADTVKDGKGLSGGEKEKVPVRQASRGSASSGAGSTRDNSEREVSVDDGLDLPPNRLGKLCENLGKARGPDTCSYCVGICCALM